MAPNKTTLSMLTELAKFAQGVRDKPYEDLPRLASDGGWVWHARQTGVEHHDLHDSLRDQQGAPSTGVATVSAIAVHFELMLGKADTPLDIVDTLTVQVPGGTPNVSLAARAMLGPAIIYTVFGRLPPAPPPREQRPAAEEQQIDMSRGDGDVPLPGEKPLPVEPNREPLNVVKEHTPDGVPVFVDPYALAEDAGDLIDALLEEVRSWLPRAASAEQLLALFDKNEEAMNFIRDLGDVRDQKELKLMLDQRHGDLAVTPAPVASPRRRVRV